MVSAHHAVAKVTLRIVLTVVAALIAFLFALPIIWMVASALRPPAAIFQYLYPFSIHAFVPKEFTLSNYVSLLSGVFLRNMMNSLVVAFGTIALGTTVCATAAYALSALRFPLREPVFAIVVVSFMVPFEAVAIPLSSLFKQWHLEDSYLGLILPGIANGLAIFLLRQFFLAVPKELLDASQIDGARHWTIFSRIYIPLSKAAIISASLMLFIWQWQAYLWPLLVVTQQQFDTAPVALARYIQQYDYNFGVMFAGAFLLSVIPAAIMLPLQKYLTTSVSRTGIKE